MSTPRLPALAGVSTRQGWPLPPGRVLSGVLAAALLPVTVTAIMLRWPGLIGTSGVDLVLLLCVVLTALAGGLWPALGCALLGAGLLNYFFIDPRGTLAVGKPGDVVDLLVFTLAGLLVGAVVHRAAALARRATAAAAEANTLAAVATGVIDSEEALPALLEQLRSSFAMTAVSLLSRSPDGWTVHACAGRLPPARPEDADVVVEGGTAGGTRLELALSGRSLHEADRRVLAAFAAEAAGLWQRDRLRRDAQRADRLAEADAFRNALLAALGHDLRTPLASATAAVSSLNGTDIDWTEQERAELLSTADRSLHRLGRLIADLLDLSRLQSGVLAPAIGPVWLDELVGPALDELGPAGRAVHLDLPEDLPPAAADGALVSRALVNLLANALRYSPDGRPPTVQLRARDPESLQLSVIDHGPGILPGERERAFQPFHRLHDADNDAGIGLGLALSRGLVEAMRGRLDAEQTPGGGLTMVITLPRADPGPAGPDLEAPMRG